VGLAEYRGVWRRSQSRDDIRRVSWRTKRVLQSRIADCGRFVQSRDCRERTYDQFQDYWNPVTIVLLAQAETFGTCWHRHSRKRRMQQRQPSQMAACLRGVSASTIIEQEPTLVFPFIGGTILTQTLSAAFASGEFNWFPS
jgi:hypothetical protein